MIIVCSLRAAHEQVELNRVGKAVSILSPDSEFPQFETLQPHDHLCLSFNDVAVHSPGLATPQSQDLQKLLMFIKSWDKKLPILIHCWAGVSRSTAAAYIATCLLQPKRDEVDLALELRAASPSATPNPMLIALADDALGREGRMRSAIEGIGRGANAFEGGPFTLHL